MIDPELDEELVKNGFHIEDEDSDTFVNDAERDFFTAEYDADDGDDDDDTISEEDDSDEDDA